MSTGYDILTTKRLAVGYGKKVLHQNLMLQLKKGELVGLIGPNGGGKSTLIRTLAGLQKPLEGEIFINDVPLEKLSLRKKAKEVAVVLTDYIVSQSLTVKQLVEMGRYPYTNWTGRLSLEDRGIATRAMEQVNILHKIDSPYSQLSDGEKQRVMIAKALAQDTPIILLDEPTAHLDLPNTIDIMQLLRSLARETQKAILVSTHELELALQSVDKMWILRPNSMTKGIPEDIVLQKKISEVFGTQQFYFDSQTGGFRLYHPKSPYGIQVKKGAVGSDDSTVADAYYWTLRALERSGYHLQEEAPIQITVLPDLKWRYQFEQWDEEYYTLENLLAVIASHLP